MQDRSQIFVGGKLVDSDAKGRIDVISPNTEEVIGRVPDATPADVDRAVAAAREAFDKGPFPRWSPEERADAISRLSEALKKRGQEIATTIASENGCPISMSLGTQVFASTMVLDVYAGIARSFPFDETRKGIDGPAGARAPRAGRRVRCDRAVERAALRDGDEARPGARRGLHGGGEGGARDGARSLPADGSHAGGRPAAGRAQRAHAPGARRASTW